MRRTAASDVPLFSADPKYVKRPYRPCDLLLFLPYPRLIMLQDTPQGQQDLQLEIAQLEARLYDLRSELGTSNYPTPPSSHPESKSPWTATGKASALH